MATLFQRPKSYSGGKFGVFEEHRPAREVLWMRLAGSRGSPAKKGSPFPLPMTLQRPSSAARHLRRPCTVAEILRLLPGKGLPSPSLLRSLPISTGVATKRTPGEICTQFLLPTSCDLRKVDRTGWLFRLWAPMGAIKYLVPPLI